MNSLLVSLLSEIVVVMITSITILATTCKSSMLVRKMEREDLARCVPKRVAPNKVSPEQYGGVYIPIQKPKVLTISDSVHINSLQSEPCNEVIFSSTVFTFKNFIL